MFNFKQERTKLESSEGWAYNQANVILLKLVKNKEVLARNGGGKERKMNLFVVFWLFKKSLTTLEHDTFSPGLGNPLPNS